MTCNGRCFDEVDPNTGVYTRARRCPEAHPCQLERRCPNAAVCGARPVPAWRSGYCTRCTVSLSCSKVEALPEAQCPVCLETAPLLATPAGCGHGVCADCHRAMYLGPPLPAATADRPAYARAVVQWFKGVPPSWETQACPMCRAAPTAADRVNQMISRSMLKPEELTDATVLPARIAFVVLAAKIARAPGPAQAPPLGADAV